MPRLPSKCGSDQCPLQLFFLSIVNRPGFAEVVWFKSRCHRSLTVKLLVVVCLSFCGRDMPQGSHQAPVVKPRDPFQGRQFHGFASFPWLWVPKKGAY